MQLQHRGFLKVGGDHRAESVVRNRRLCRRPNGSPLEFGNLVEGMKFGHARFNFHVRDTVNYYTPPYFYILDQLTEQDRYKQVNLIILNISPVP